MKRWIEQSSIPHILFFIGVAGFTGGIFVRSFFDVGYAGAGLCVLTGIALGVIFGARAFSQNARARRFFLLFSYRFCAWERAI